ncbi:hypothetical protein V8B97DRAFT_2004680 [Scleroderma yunnanense]
MPMLLTVKKGFCAKITNTYEEFTLCKDSWKMDNLAKQHYPSYKQTWFMNKLDEKTIPGKYKASTKAEIISDTDSIWAAGDKCMKVDMGTLKLTPNNATTKDQPPFDGLLSSLDGGISPLAVQLPADMPCNSAPSLSLAEASASDADSNSTIIDLKGVRSLSGANHAEWATNMKSTLQSKYLWLIMDG